MKITREKACQRLHHRVQTPLAVDIDGTTYQAIDWSLGGIRVGGFDVSAASVGDSLPCFFRLPFQGFEIAFDTCIEVVRLDAEAGHLAARFLDLDDRQKELMNHFIEQLIRGAMVPISDTILRIDSPVTPVSTKPDPSPVEEVPVNRWPVKLVAMSAFYVVLGCFSFYLVGSAIYNNFLSLEVENAIAGKHVEPIISLTDGKVIQVAVNQERTVAAGEPLFRISSPDLNRRIKDAKVLLEQSKLELESLRKKHAVVIDIHDSHLTKEARFLEIEIDKKQQEVTLATESLVTLYEHKEELLVASPNRGRVVRLLRQEGSFVQKGDTLAYFEQDDSAFVSAYLKPEEAAHLRLNEVAVVHSRYLNVSWRATVRSIEPAEPMAIEYVPGEDFMRVVLTLEGNTDGLTSGSPVTVQFPATRVDDWLPGRAPSLELAYGRGDEREQI